MRLEGEQPATGCQQPAHPAQGRAQVGRGVQGVGRDDQVVGAVGEALPAGVGVQVQRAVVDEGVAAETVLGAGEEARGDIGEVVDGALRRQQRDQGGGGTTRAGADLQDPQGTVPGPGPHDLRHERGQDPVVAPAGRREVVELLEGLAGALVGEQVQRVLPAAQHLGQMRQLTDSQLHFGSEGREVQRQPGQQGRRVRGAGQPPLAVLGDGGQAVPARQPEQGPCQPLMSGEHALPDQVGGRELGPARGQQVRERDRGHMGGEFLEPVHEVRGAHRAGGCPRRVDAARDGVGEVVVAGQRRGRGRQVEVRRGAQHRLVPPGSPVRRAGQAPHAHTVQFDGDAAVRVGDSDVEAEFGGSARAVADMDQPRRGRAPPHAYGPDRGRKPGLPGIRAGGGERHARVQRTVEQRRMCHVSRGVGRVRGVPVGGQHLRLPEVQPHELPERGPVVQAARGQFAVQGVDVAAAGTAGAHPGRVDPRGRAADQLTDPAPGVRTGLRAVGFGAVDSLAAGDGHHAVVG